MLLLSHCYLKITGIHTRKWYNKEKDKRYNLDQVPLISVGVVQGASVLWGRLIPPPLTEIPGNFAVLVLLTRFESRYTTTTVVSSWKWRRTPRSIFFKSEYLISLFFAASWSAAFTSLLALPWKHSRWNMNTICTQLSTWTDQIICYRIVFKPCIEKYFMCQET